MQPNTRQNFYIEKLEPACYNYMVFKGKKNTIFRAEQIKQVYFTQIQSGIDFIFKNPNTPVQKKKLSQTRTIKIGSVNSDRFAIYRPIAQTY